MPLLFGGKAMVHEVFAVGVLGCNCSVLGEESTGEAMVVDPGAEVATILAVLARHELTLRRIVVTHAHIDHIAGARALQRATGAPILYNERDLPLVRMMEVQAGWIGVPVPEVALPDESLEHGMQVGVEGLPATALHTPGHTEGSVCLYLPERGLLLAGDTLFAGSVGRTDLPGGDMRALLRSIRESLLVLPDATRVVPGHGPETTIGAEREGNPFLRGL